MSDRKVVLITGVSSGIGSATAEHLVNRGRGFKSLSRHVLSRQIR